MNDNKRKERLTAASMKVLVYSWQRLSFTGVLIFFFHLLQRVPEETEDDQTVNE